MLRSEEANHIRSICRGQSVRMKARKHVHYGAYLQHAIGCLHRRTVGHMCTHSGKENEY